jgi:hypothetical protein
MSTHVTGAFSSHDADVEFDELLDELPDDLARAIDRRIDETVQERTAQLEQELEAERDARKELEQEIESNQTLIDAFRTQISRLKDLIVDDVEFSMMDTETVEPITERVENHGHRIDALMDGLNALEVESSDGEDGGGQPVTAPQIRDTPLERVFIDPESSGVRITESVTRAMSIAGHFERWSKSVKAGRVITEDIRKMVNTALDDSLSWKQVHRACHVLEDLTNGEIEFRLTDKHGRILVMEDKSWLSSLKRVVSEKSGG